MKNTVSFLISIILVTLLFSGCKKYDEGPKFSLRSVKNRLTNGDWELEKLTVAGIDSTDEYSLIEFNLQIDASEGLDSKNYTFDLSYTYQGQLVKVTNGDIDFQKEGDVIIFKPYYDYYTTYYYSPIFYEYDTTTNNEIEWDIEKLTNKEFWLKTKVNNQIVEMKLTKNK